MAKKPLDTEFEDANRDTEDSSSDGRVHITDDVRKAIEYVIDKMAKVKMEQEAIKEDINAIAAKMGSKPAQVKGIINLVIKEQEKGGVIIEEEQRLDWTREVLEKMGMTEQE